MYSMIEEVVAHVSNNLIDLYTRGVVAWERKIKGEQKSRSDMSCPVGWIYVRKKPVVVSAR